MRITHIRVRIRYPGPVRAERVAAQVERDFKTAHPGATVEVYWAATGEEEHAVYARRPDYS